MTYEQIVNSKKFKVWACIVISAVVLIVVFAAGVFIGQEKAKFSYHYNDSYMRNFGGRGLPPMSGDKNFMNPHGSDGQIIKIESNTITLKSPNGTEKNILVESDTTIRRGRDDIKVADLKINDDVVVIGSPDDQGQLQAKLIRVITP